LLCPIAEQTITKINAKQKQTTIHKLNQNKTKGFALDTSRAKM